MHLEDNIRHVFAIPGKQKLNILLQFQLAEVRMIDCNSKLARSSNQGLPLGTEVLKICRNSKVVEV